MKVFPIDSRGGGLKRGRSPQWDAQELDGTRGTKVGILAPALV